MSFISVLVYQSTTRHLSDTALPEVPAVAHAEHELPEKPRALRATHSQCTPRACDTPGFQSPAGLS